MVLPLVLNGTRPKRWRVDPGQPHRERLHPGRLDFLWQVAQQIAIGVNNALEHEAVGERAG